MLFNLLQTCNTLFHFALKSAFLVVVILTRASLEAAFGHNSSYSSQLKTAFTKDESRSVFYLKNLVISF